LAALTVPVSSIPISLSLFALALPAYAEGEKRDQPAATRNLATPSIRVAPSGAVICVTFFRPAIGYGNRLGQQEALKGSMK